MASEATLSIKVAGDKVAASGTPYQLTHAFGKPIGRDYVIEPIKSKDIAEGMLSAAIQFVDYKAAGLESTDLKRFVTLKAGQHDLTDELLKGDAPHLATSSASHAEDAKGWHFTAHNPNADTFEYHSSTREFLDGFRYFLRVLGLPNGAPTIERVFHDGTPVEL